MYCFVLIYIVLIVNSGDDAGFSAVMLLAITTLIPVTFFMVMLSNAFGFENRELLLSLQFPAEKNRLFYQRIKSAILIAAIGSLFIPVMIPFLIESPLTMIQMFLGVLLICLTFLYFISWSSFANYKKIEQVSLMSLSNPVVPSSVSFASFFVVLIVGIISFPVYESFQIYHILALVAANAILVRSLMLRFRSIDQKISNTLIPKIWNEL